MAHDEEIGARMFEIRAACGHGVRDPETLKAFSERIAQLTGVAYGEMTLSNMETGKRRWLVTDINAVAAVDPLKRGREWLAWGDSPGEILLDPTQDRGLTLEEEERALEAGRRSAGARKQQGRGRKR